MVLSRIWSAFIIVAILVASIKYLFSDNYKAIYNDMVVGKSGDTVQIASKKITELNPEIQRRLDISICNLLAITDKFVSAITSSVDKIP